MGIFKKYKTTILIIAIAIMAGVAYTILFGGEDSTLLVSERQDNAASVEESNLLTFLLDLRSVKLDENIFSDPVFKSLEDFGQELTAEPIGRENPFAPIGITSSDEE
jgi:hypothetical protein|tara:strand:- start:4785 stop:5105 length:321 start_codon:yes stop_codon:yes gene_type:complete